MLDRIKIMNRIEREIDAIEEIEEVMRDEGAQEMARILRHGAGREKQPTVAEARMAWESSKRAQALSASLRRRRESISALSLALIANDLVYADAEKTLSPPV